MCVFSFRNVRHHYFGKKYKILNMVLRWLFKSLVNNAALIEKLSQTYPVRRAAQLTVYWFRRSQAAIEDAGKSTTAKAAQKEIEGGINKVYRFKDTFKSELRSGFKELKEEMKKESKR